MKTLIFILVPCFFPTLIVSAQDSTKRTVHIAGFYIDSSEIKSGEPYKQYPVHEEKKKAKNSQTSSNLVLLRNKYWTTCAIFDSLDQYGNIQLISTTKLSGYSNCTMNGGARSEWFFSDSGKEKTLTIKMRTGWVLKDAMLTQTTIKWRWTYDPKYGNIYIYKLQAKGIYDPGPEKAVFYFKIAEISKDNIIFSVLKL